ncbi:hypothetical protein H257_09536 [Aphanomyces astaci]|uniref:Chromo domain-containing protein n=1 Tax=Aphanomyces astaci TaxID=112090 RepID=W4GBT6_APHAT|nr:hypothetical protein H257_09536 [Aphanomyces astaci]ETV76534.1 hypothetical protein H257_09536 [Aphanomyces astaci]|eukprot:XP_009834079.1 hypothetical protein H257_09536 [Aphanomyces astaci]
MATALDKMHATVLDAATRKRQKNRERRSKKEGAEMAQFDVDDFVLYMDVCSISHSKLSVTWRGPAQVVKTTSDWIFEIQNLVTGVVREAHSSRLKFYADDALDVTEELLRHIVHNADGHVVDQFLDCRYNDRMAAFEVCLRWRGLQAIEDSWEPAANLLEDIPTEFKRCVRSNKADPQVKAMAAALGMTESLGGIVANLPFAEPLSPSQEVIQVLGLSPNDYLPLGGIHFVIYLWIGLRKPSHTTYCDREKAEETKLQGVHQASVEEAIGDIVLPHFQAKSYKFHTAGREDRRLRGPRFVQPKRAGQRDLFNILSKFVSLG